MKKFLLIMLSLALIFSLLGCQKQEAKEPTEEEISVEQPVDSTGTTTENKDGVYITAPAYENPDDVKKVPEPPVYKAEASGKITLTMSAEPTATLAAFVPVTIVVKNEGEGLAAYLVGPSSNVVPDGIVLESGGLALLVPEVANLNDEVRTLKPGESITYTATYAPYIGANAYINSLIEFFADNADYTAANGDYTINATLTWVDLKGTTTEDGLDVFNAYYAGVQQKISSSVTVTINA